MSIDELEGLDEVTRKEIEELEKITREKDSSESFAKAKYLIADIFKEENQPIKALKAWDEIRREDSPIWYAKAQIDKGLVYFNLEQSKKSYQAFNNIEKTDSLIHYMMAQYGMGALLTEDNNRDEALIVWNNLKGIGNSLDTAKLKFKIGGVLVGENFAKYDEAKQFFVESLEHYPYEAYCYKKICDLLIESESKTVGEKVLQLLDKTLNIVNVLKLDFGQETNEEKSPERKLAHYTNTSITNLLLETDTNNSLPSFFRLNTINNVNDPSEGHLLTNHLNGLKESYFRAPDFDGKLHAFISCFTFNHDSLNQFRLYGKEGDKEASGVSLVFKKEFFQSDNSSGGLSFLSLDNSFQNSNKDFNSQSIDEQSSVNQSSEGKLKVNKQPVMRCVYLDPTSNYIQLAQRNRVTFFREFGNETVVIEDIEISKAEHEWKKYENYIDKKTKDFNNAFIILKSIYKLIIKEKVRIKKNNSELSDDIEILLDEILLPLKYLIKHSAFQEEQECRMVYVTSINAPEVMMQNKKLLFVEYQAEVKENLNKVYIAPAATEYQLYLAWLLRDTNVKIELSNNPYRQT